MEQNHTSRTFAELARFAYKSPRGQILSIPVAIVFLIDYMIVRNAELTGVVFIGSFLLVLLFDILFVKIARFVFPFRRILFMDFISLMIWSVFFWIIYYIHFTALPDLVMIAMSSVSLMRVLILFGYYSERSYKTILPSLNYTYAAAVAIILMYGFIPGLIPFVISSVIYSVAGSVFVRRSTRRFQEAFDESPTEMIKFFLNYKSTQGASKAGQKFFDKIYRHSREVPVKIMDIINTGGKRKAMLVFPYIHPGPFGLLGSSGLPSRLQARLNDFGADLMVFHTTTTNSNNCRGDQDIDAIAEGIRKASGHLEFADTMSEFHRVPVDDHVAGIQVFGNFAFASLIPENDAFDDVNLEEGLRVIEAMKGNGLSDMALIDAQNYFRDGLRELRDCSHFIPAFKNAVPAIGQQHRARVGYARRKGQFEGLAEMGIQVLVTEAGENRQAIVLTDSNNITGDVIEKARSITGDLVSNLEVYTTDNHVVNGGSLDMNPLGMKCDIDSLASLIRETVNDAVEDVEDVRIGMASEDVNVKMGDENSFQELIDVVFSSIKTAKRTIAVAIPSALALSLAIFFGLLSLV